MTEETKKVETPVEAPATDAPVEAPVKDDDAE